jgi:hypothetical protein
MARQYRQRIRVTVAADAPDRHPATFRWRDTTYRVAEVLARGHERGRWWTSVASAAVATPSAPQSPHASPSTGPTDRHYYRLLCDSGTNWCLLCEVYYDAATDEWVLDRVLD